MRGADISTTFEAQAQGGEALPAIWDNWDDFSALMNELAESTAALAQHAHEGGREAIMGEAVAALPKSCRGCHDTYREKK